MNDLISRQAAIDKLETIGYDFSNSELSEIELEEVCEAVGDVRQDMISMIKRLPSAQPEIITPTHEELYALIDRQPTIEPERKNDTIQKFHDYQVEWLLSHCDLELEPQLEEWVVRFLHDTANCYMME